MAADDFSMTYDEIRQRVGYRKGYGVNVSDWEDDEEKASLVEMALVDGANTFYTAYEWSFLQPQRTLTIESATDELILPGDFGIFLDKIYYTDTNFGGGLCLVNDGKISLKRQQGASTTGLPQFAAEIPIEPTQQQGPRKKLIFWPTADQDYSITVRYKINARVLSTDNPHPYGGAIHATTILHSCLAAVEQDEGTIGPATQLYQMALAKSIENDRKNKAPTLGPPRGRGYGRQWPYVAESIATYDP